MFVSLWHYFIGYVIVEISGYSLEKFINLALKEQLVFWDVKREEHCLIVKTTSESFKKLKSHAKASRCRLRIVEKKGLPFVCFRYRRRKILLGGIILFVSILYGLSSFVWLIEVEGNQKIEATEIIETLESSGYTVGKWKKNLNLRQAEQKIIQTHSEITWAGAKFQGTKLIVEISEAVEKPIMQAKDEPTHLVAKRDAYITYIATHKGIPKVKKGDIVRKGDLLVSGEITMQDELESIYLTHADAEIKGRTSYTLKARYPLVISDKVYTGEVNNQYMLQLFGLKIPFWSKPTDFMNYETEVSIKQMRFTDSFVLPFYFHHKKDVAYIHRAKIVDETLAKEKLLTNLYDKLSYHIGTKGKIVYYEVNYHESEGYLVGLLNAIVEEPIGVETPIIDSEIGTDQQP